MRQTPLAPAETTSTDPASWHELLSIVFDGAFSAEARLEALIDHVERGGPRQTWAEDRR